MSTLLERMQKSGSIKGAAVLSESSFFNAKDVIPTDLPILNIAFSGSLDGGLIPGLTIFAGLSKSFKTLLGLYCMKAYFNKYPDAIALLYDSEFGITPDYLESNGIDPERVLHIPVEHVEQLKFDIVKRLDEVKRGDKVFIMLDSLGNLASKKEVEDAENEKSVADMSRAKAIRSLLRIITPHLTMKDLPCIVINHVYQEIGMFPKTIIPGGTAVTYAANQIFVIGKAQEKEGTELSGYKFTINIEKSRFVKEKAKLPFTVLYDSGIQKWSSLFDLAVESGHIIKVNQGWYSTVDMTTGEIADGKRRAKDIENDDEFFVNLIKDDIFKNFVEKKFKLGAMGAVSASAYVEEDYEEED
jgi:RecA/RadA recombinase